MTRQQNQRGHGGTNLGCWACPRRDCANRPHSAASRREVPMETLACLASPSEGPQAAQSPARGPRPRRKSTPTAGSAEIAPRQKTVRGQSCSAPACGLPAVSATTPTAGPRPRAHARSRVAALRYSAGPFCPSPAGRQYPARRARSSSQTSAACVASDQMPWRWWHWWRL
jgi:hypothetical protein